MGARLIAVLKLLFQLSVEGPNLASGRLPLVSLVHLRNRIERTTQVTAGDLLFQRSGTGWLTARRWPGGTQRLQLRQSVLSPGLIAVLELLFQLRLEVFKFTTRTLTAESGLQLRNRVESAAQVSTLNLLIQSPRMESPLTLKITLSLRTKIEHGVLMGPLQTVLLLRRLLMVREGWKLSGRRTGWSMTLIRLGSKVIEISIDTAHLASCVLCASGMLSLCRSKIVGK